MADRLPIADDTPAVAVRPPRARWWIWATAAGAVILLLALADHPAAEWGLANSTKQPWLGLRNALRPLGSGACQAAAILLLLAWGVARGRRQVVILGRWLLLALILATLVATAGKWTVRRPRPAMMHTPRPTLMTQIQVGEWHSFPSGDVTAASALAVLLWGTSLRRRRWGWLLAIPLLVGLQRFLAARHFLTDIAGGLVLGGAVGAVLASQMRRRLLRLGLPPGW